MASIDNREAIQRWTRDHSNGGLHPRRGYRGGTVLGIGQEMIYRRTNGYKRVAWGPVTLARYSTQTRTFVLNGDGFTDRNATHWQDMLRGEVIRREFPYIIIPFAAMSAASILADTVRPIEVTQDRWDEVVHEVPDPPPLKQFKIQHGAGNENTRVHEATAGGVRFRYSEFRRSRWRNKKTGATASYAPWSQRDNGEWVQEWVWTHRGGEGPPPLTVWAAGEVVPAAWQGLDAPGGGADTWHWVERIHRLGASIFSADDGDGRKRFISAFDQNEPRPMYFLAQLPRNGRVASYEDALEALSPPLVKEARAKGLTVRRQGDVFAIPTERSDEWIYANARTRVRREVATHDPTRQGIEPPQLDELDTRERGVCPCCGTSMKIGWGPKCRRALMIYGTSHTADEVVVVSGGAVYVRGVMHHDPHLEEPGRRPEHITVNLGDRWHLAVRNTVPRRKQRNPEPGEEESA